MGGILLYGWTGLVAWPKMPSKRSVAELCCREGVQSMARMAPYTKKAFDIFVMHANKSGLHQTDWERFYQFVRTAHRYRSQIWEQDVKLALIEEGFSEEYARKLCMVYRHCWQMLSSFSSPWAAKAWRERIREEVAERWAQSKGC